MPFAYYRKLSAAQKRIYRASDAVGKISLPRAAELKLEILALARALKTERRTTVEKVCQRLGDGITERLGVPPVRVTVLAVRPHNDWGELHGLYEAGTARRRARIWLWMRTARHRRVVAFRSFLRTLLHELGHHLDGELLRLADSFHTEGFYRRESSLFRQLVDGPGNRRTSSRS